MYRGWGGKRAKVGYEEYTQDISKIDLRLILAQNRVENFALPYSELRSLAIVER